uniref:Uncharacterized protein n=1 Tax=viral metagenome TaxID=1070528 RepID=A0A6C0IAG1_9ZZZZ
MDGCPSLNMCMGFDPTKQLAKTRVKHTLSDIVHDFSSSFKNILGEYKFLNSESILHEVYSAPPYNLTDAEFSTIASEHNPLSDFSSKSMFRKQLDLISFTFGKESGKPCLGEFEEYKKKYIADFENDNVGVTELLNILTKNGASPNLAVYLDAQFGNPCKKLGEVYKQLYPGLKANWIINLAYQIDPGSKWDRHTTIYNTIPDTNEIIFRGDQTGLQTCKLSYQDRYIYRTWNGQSQEKVEKNSTSIAETVSAIEALLHISPVKKQFKIIEKTAGDRFQTVQIKYYPYPLENSSHVFVTNDILELYDCWWHKVPNVLFTASDGIYLYKFDENDISEISEADIIRIVEFIGITANIDIIQNILQNIIIKIREEADKYIVNPRDNIFIILSKIMSHFNITKYLKKAYSVLLLKFEIIRNIAALKVQYISESNLTTRQDIYNKIIGDVRKNYKFLNTLINTPDNIFNFFGLNGYNHERFTERDIKEYFRESDYEILNKRVFVYGIHQYIQDHIDSDMNAAEITCAIIIKFYNPTSRGIQQLIDILVEMYGSENLKIIRDKYMAIPAIDLINDIMNRIIGNKIFVGGSGSRSSRISANANFSSNDLPRCFELFETYDTVMNRDYSNTLLDSIVSEKYYEDLYKTQQEKLTLEIFKRGGKILDIERELLCLKLLYSSRKRSDQILDILFNIYNEKDSLRDNYFVSSIYSDDISTIIDTISNNKELSQKLGSIKYTRKQNVLHNSKKSSLKGPSPMINTYQKQSLGIPVGVGGGTKRRRNRFKKTRRHQRKRS